MLFVSIVFDRVLIGILGRLSVYDRSCNEEVAWILILNIQEVLLIRQPHGGHGIGALESKHLLVNSVAESVLNPTYEGPLPQLK